MPEFRVDGGECDESFALNGVGDPGLLAVQHPVVAIQFGSGLYSSNVSARTW